MKRTIILAGPLQRERAHAAIDAAQDGWVVTIKEPARNLEQNAMLWVILGAFADQLVWPVNGELVKLEAEEWKSILSAAFKKESARIAQGVDGGIVMLGMRTSKMGKREFSEFLEFLHMVAADRGVKL